MKVSKPFPFDMTNIAPPGASPITTTVPISPVPNIPPPTVNPPGIPAPAFNASTPAPIAPPKAAAPDKAQKPKRKRGGKSSRRPEEDIPSADYIEQLQALGPREGESIIAFHMRMASTIAGRNFMLVVAQKYDSNIERLCKEMGIQRHNLSFYLTRVGLTTADVRQFRNGHNQ